MTAPRKQGPRKRLRQRIELTLLPEAIAVLTVLARTHGSRSAAVEAYCKAVGILLVDHPWAGQPD